MTAIANPPDDPNDGLFARARGGDQSAWEELFHTCYPKVVRVVRRKLNPPMRSLYDSTDFANEVWRSLLAKSDRFDFPTVDELMAFLAKAAHQKVIDEYRRMHTQKRDIGREQSMDAAGAGGAAAGMGLASHDPTPSQVAVANEGLHLMHAGLSADESRALELKRAGHSVEEISAELGWHIRKVQRFFQGLRPVDVGPKGGAR